MFWSCLRKEPDLLFPPARKSALQGGRVLLYAVIRLWLLTGLALGVRGDLENSVASRYRKERQRSCVAAPQN